MNKRLSIIVISLAIVLTMIAVGVHHHHHGEMMYLELSECCDNGAQDSQQEDNNTDHTLHYLSAGNVKMVQTGQAANPHHGFFGSGILMGCEVECPQPAVTNCHLLPSVFYERALLSWRQTRMGLRGPPYA